MAKRRAEGYKPPSRATRPCSVEGCAKPSLGRGWCSMHYSRWRKTGEIGSAEPMRRGPRPCRVEGCHNKAISADDLCPTHCRRKRLYDNPDGSFATTKSCAVINCYEPAVPTPRSSDFCRVHLVDFVKCEVAAGQLSGKRTPRGYIYISIFKKQYAEHAIIMEAMLGRPLRHGESVHHRNGIRYDNRPENLELWVKPQIAGQRVEDLVAFVVENYPEWVHAYIEGRPQLRIVFT